jgi:alkyl hydroperoxide reductase subunit AhpF
MFLNEQVSADVKERFAEMVHPVKLVVFSQTLEHPESEEVKRLVEEVAALDSRLTVESKNFIIDGEAASALKVHHVPGIAFLRKGADGVADIDYGVRFFGLPMQYDFGVVIDAIVAVSRGESGLDDATVQALQSLKDPVHLQVFTTPT